MIDMWQKLYESVVKNIKQMEETIRSLVTENEILKAEKKQWSIEKINQQSVIQQELSRMNLINNKYLEEIQELKKRLKDGDYNRLEH